MATKTNKTTAKKADDMDLARKIWLAGVGAYGRVFADAQERLEKLADNAGDMFEELVAKGEEIEEEVRDRISENETAGKVTNFVTRAQKFRDEQRAALETRVAAVRRNFGETFSAPANLFTLGRTLETLTKKVDALADDVAAIKKSAKPARGKKA